MSRTENYGRRPIKHNRRFEHMDGFRYNRICCTRWRMRSYEYEMQEKTKIISSFTNNETPHPTISHRSWVLNPPHLATQPSNQFTTILTSLLHHFTNKHSSVRVKSVSLRCCLRVPLVGIICCEQISIFCFKLRVASWLLSYSICLNGSQNHWYFVLAEAPAWFGRYLWPLQGELWWLQCFSGGCAAVGLYGLRLVKRNDTQYIAIQYTGNAGAQVCPCNRWSNGGAIKSRRSNQSTGVQIVQQSNPVINQHINTSTHWSSRKPMNEPTNI